MIQHSKFFYIFYIWYAVTIWIVTVLRIRVLECRNVHLRYKLFTVWSYQVLEKWVWIEVADYFWKLVIRIPTVFFNYISILFNLWQKFENQISWHHESCSWVWNLAKGLFINYADVIIDLSIFALHHIL